MYIVWNRSSTWWILKILLLKCLFQKWFSTFLLQLQKCFEGNFVKIILGFRCEKLYFTLLKSNLSAIFELTFIFKFPNNTWGCVDDNGLFVELGRDVLMRNIVHRCYRVDKTTVYHRFACVRRTLAECILTPPVQRLPPVSETWFFHWYCLLICLQNCFDILQN